MDPAARPARGSCRETHETETEAPALQGRRVGRRQATPRWRHQHRTTLQHWPHSLEAPPWSAGGGVFETRLSAIPPDRFRMDNERQRSNAFLRLVRCPRGRRNAHSIDTYRVRGRVRGRTRLDTDRAACSTGELRNARPTARSRDRSRPRRRRTSLPAACATGRGW